MRHKTDARRDSLAYLNHLASIARELQDTENDNVIQRKLAKEELEAIEMLRKVATKWPTTLWLYSTSGTLWVMKKKNGERATVPGGDGMDEEFAVTSIDIENDGGDW